MCIGQPHRQTIVRLRWFAVVGLLATGVHASAGLALHRWAETTPLVANAVAFSVAFLVSFFGQWRFTFPEATGKAPAFLRFSAAALFGFGLSQAIVWAVTVPFGAPYGVALAIVLSTVPPVTFCALRYWAFRL